MSFDETMEQFEAELNKRYPLHVKKGDKVQMYARHESQWELRDTGTVTYVGPGYCLVEFWKNAHFNGELRLELNREDGTINQQHHLFGFRFRGVRRT